MAETALAEAFARQGVHLRDAEFKIAIAKYINAGGTFEGAERCLAEAKGMSGMGQLLDVRNDPSGSAQTRQPVEGGEAIVRVTRVQPPVASPPSSNHDERCHIVCVQQDQTNHASSHRVPDRGGEGHHMAAPSGQARVILPVREPKPQRVPIDFGAASVAIKTKLAKAYLDRAHTSDGRSWGDVGAHELDGMERDGVLAQALKAHIGVLSNSQRFKSIRELVNDETFEAIRSKVHGA